MKTLNDSNRGLADDESRTLDAIFIDDVLRDKTDKEDAMTDIAIDDSDYMCVMEALEELDIRDIALPDSPYDAATVLRVDISVVLVPGTVLLRYNPDELLFKDKEAEVAFRRHVMSFFLRGGYRLANTITEREVLYIATSLQDREGYLISWADDLFFEPEEAKQLNQMLAEEIIKSSALILHP